MVDPFITISSINVRLSVQEIADGGIDSVTGGTPSAGKFVTFNKTFVDVRSIVVTAVENASYPITPSYVFGTEIDGGFTAYLKRTDTGAFITGEFSWSVRGV